MDRPDTRPVLARPVLFHCLANNIDLKSRNGLHGTDGRLWDLVNGLRCAAGFKPRTVVWDFFSQPLPETSLTAAFKPRG